MKVLILSASTGNGHISAAKAIEKEALAAGMDAKAVDTLQLTHKGFKTWYGDGYETAVRHYKSLWGYLYKISDVEGFAYKFQTLLDGHFVKPVLAELEAFRPDIVVCTHSLPQPWLATQRPVFGFKMAVVVTDMYPHRMWLRGEPDHFFVPSQWTADILGKRLTLRPDQITVTGIPVDPLFAAGEHRTADPPFVFVSTGGIGAGPLFPAGKAVAESDPNVRVTIVCGRNRRAYEYVSQAAAALPPEIRERVEVRQQVSQAEMADFMHRASFTVGKPGGLTTSEALAAGCPFVVYMPLLIPGQEEGNADFLRDNDAGAIAKSIPELRDLSASLLQDRGRLARMSANARRLGLPNAARDIVRTLAELP